MAKWALGCLALCGAMVFAGASLHAHHSLAGVYALGKEAQVHGTFNSFKIVNPHSSMKLDVKTSDGTVQTWSFVGGSATAIARFGLKDGPNALHFGDEITVTCTPAADGKSPVGLLVAITYKDGHTIRFRSPDE
jgi:uncharacterized protein DUF6152